MLNQAHSSDQMSVQPCTVCIYKEKAEAPVSRLMERCKSNVMETFATWKTILTNDLYALTQLKGQDDMSLMRYAMKEMDIGMHCYQAEECLTDAELAFLKKVLHLPELKWRVYKSKLRFGSE